MNQMNACPRTLRHERHHDMGQGVSGVGEGLELFWATPLECKELIRRQCSDTTTDRAVVLTIDRLPKQFVLSTDLRLDFGNGGEPRRQKIRPREVLEGAGGSHIDKGQSRP